jgi:hypothetical protein
MAERYRLEIPFVHHDRSGVVSVTCGPNDSVVGSGFDLLQGAGFDVNMCLGYPTMRAWVISYEGSGYRTLMAWVQVIVSRRYARREDDAPLQEAAELDTSDEMREMGIPFFGWGYPAAIYDAPCNNLGDDARLDWSAETFLVTFPSRLTNHKVAWLAGFRWGYSEWDEAGVRRVSLAPTEELSRAAWEVHLPLLRETCPAWSFV